MKNLKKFILALGFGLVSSTCFVSATEPNALPETPKISEDKKLSSANNQFTRILNEFGVLESFLNSYEKQNLMWIKSFLSGKLKDVANVPALANILNVFNVASMKLEILTVAHELKNINFLVANAISDLDVQKIRLKLLFNLCTTYKNFVGKSAFTLSNNTATKMLFDVLPDNFKRSSIVCVLTWLKKSSRDLSSIKSFLSEDFYAKYIVESLEYMNLILDYNSTLFGNKPLKSDVFVNRIDSLINELFKINENKNIEAIVELLVAKLMRIKEQVWIFDENLSNISKNTAKLELLSRFKVLVFENKSFKTLRSNKLAAHTLDLFIVGVRQYLVSENVDQVNLAKLFEIKHLLLNLKQEYLPTPKGKLAKMLDFGCGWLGYIEKEISELTVICEMLSILEGVIKEVTSVNSKTGNIVSEGMNMLEQLKTAGFDGSMIAELAGAFLNKRFKTWQEAITFIAAKTGPVWMKKIVPFLPEDIQSTASALLNVLVDAKSATGAIDEAVNDNAESVVATVNNA